MIGFIKRHLIYLILILLALAGIVIYIIQSGDIFYQLLFHLQDSEAVAKQVRQDILSYGKLAPLLFIATQILQVVLAPIPGEASGFLGGYLFGTWPSFIYSSIGLTIGSWLAFAIGRLFDDLVRTKLHQTRVYHRFNHLVFKGGFIIPFILFLIPGFPKDSLSYLLGLSTMPLPVFLFITLVGRMPGTFMLSIQGAQVFEGNYVQLVLLLVLSVIIAAPCYYYRRQILHLLTRYNHKRQNRQRPNTDV